MNNIVFPYYHNLKIYFASIYKSKYISIVDLDLIEIQFETLCCFEKYIMLILSWENKTLNFSSVFALRIKFGFNRSLKTFCIESQVRYYLSKLFCSESKCGRHRSFYNKVNWKTPEREILHRANLRKKLAILPPHFHMKTPHY